MFDSTWRSTFHGRRGIGNMDTILIVKVKTDQPETKVLEQEGNRLKIALKAKPIENQANVELLKFLKKTLKMNVRLASGKKTPTKVIEVY